MRGQRSGPLRLGGLGPGARNACRRPHLRHPLRFIACHLGGRGLGEGSKNLIGLALAIVDLPRLHQGEAGRGSRGDVLGGQGFLDGGIDLAQRAMVAAGPRDSGGAQFGGEAGDLVAGIAGGSNEFYAVGGKVAGEGIEGALAPSRGRTA